MVNMMPDEFEVMVESEVRGGVQSGEGERRMLRESRSIEQGL